MRIAKQLGMPSEARDTKRDNCMKKKTSSSRNRPKSKISKPNTLRVLLIEDNENDALLIIRELKKGGYDAVHERVETAAAMKKALKEKQWDIILCDYKLPRFSGHKAIALLQETNIDIPIIIVSGTIGEETAIECIRLGAHDYIMKNNLARLCSAVNRELEEAQIKNKERKDAEKKLKVLTDRLEFIMAATKTNYDIIDDDFNLIYVDQQWQKIYGNPEGRKCYEYFMGRKDMCPGCAIPKALKTKQIVVTEEILPRENNRIIEVHTIPFKETDGRWRVAEFNIDITERKAAEAVLREQEERFRVLIENSSDAITLISAEGTILYDSPSISSVLGYKPTERLGHSVFEYVSPEEQRNMRHGFIEFARQPGAVAQSGWVFLHKDGSPRYIEGVRTNLLSETAIQAIVVNYRDITERKQAEEKLQKSEEKYRLTFASTSDIIFTLDAKLQIANITPSIKKILDLKEENLIGKPIAALNIMTPDSLEKIIHNIKQIISGKFVPPDVYELIGKDNAISSFEITTSPIIRENKIIGVSCVARNVTDRIKTEKTLKESEENFRRSLDDSPLGVRIVSIGGKTIYANDAILNIYGYKNHEELNTTPIKERYTPESYAAYQARKIVRDQGKESPSEYEISIVRKNGEIRHLEVFRKKIIWNGKKQFQVVYHDITKQKEAEQALLRSEEKYRTILETMEEGFYEVDLAGNITYANDAMCHIHRYSREELIGMNYRRFTSPETTDDIYKKYNNVYKTGISSKGHNHRIIRNDGETRILDLAFALKRDSSGKKIGFRGTVRDITERVKAETALQESELLLRKSQEVARLGSYNLDAIKGTLARSPILEDIFGIDESYPKDVSGWINLIHPEEREEMLNYISKYVLSQHHPFEKDYRIIRKNDGQVRWVSGLGELIIDKNDRVTNMIGTIQDITERKKAEEALKERDILFRKLSFHVPGMIYQFKKNADGTYCLPFTTEAIKYIFGLSPEDVSDDFSPLAKLVVPEDINRFIDSIETSAKHMISWECEFRVQLSDQPIKWMFGQSTPEKLPDGSIVWHGFVMDVTERKLAEEEIYKKHEELETMIESSPIMIYFKDLNNKFTRVNKAVFEVSGLSKEEMEGKSNEEINPRQAAILLKEDREIIATGKPLIGNVETIKTKKGPKILQTDKVPYRDKQGNIIGIIGFSMDITEQKKAQDALIASEEKYRSLVENSQEGVYQTTPDGKLITVNNSFARILGYSSAKEILKSVTDITNQLYVYPQDRERLLKLVGKYGSVTNFETQLYRKDGSRIWSSLSANAALDDQKRVLYYQGMIQDISEKKQIEAERSENVKTLRKALGATINAMAVTVETRDPYTAGHQRRVADLARAIATEMKLTSDQIDGVRMAGMIHDIGKISIPSEILTKPTQLSALEYNLIKTHPDSGHAILKDIEFPWPIARIVLEHHERVNGSGYPHGLKENEILMESKILAVADVVEAISSHRPYRAAHGIEAGLQEIANGRGVLYDADVVGACLRLFREKSYTLAA